MATPERRSLGPRRVAAGRAVVAVAAARRGAGGYNVAALP
jgi:hypothetical protein